MPKHAKTCVLLLALLIFTVSSGDAIRQDSGDQNLYVHQAQALLHGRLDIGVALHDTAMRDGKYYVVFPPFPALLLLPFVALLGVAGTKTVLISVLISVLNVALLMKILERLEVAPHHVLWVAAAFFLGTAYWSSLRASAGVWFFAHIVAVGCALVAIDQALGRGSGVLTGLFLGMACLTRQLSIYQAVFLGAALLYNPRYVGKSRAINIAGCVGALCLCVCVYLAFNWLRFGDPLDTGYAYLPLEGHLKERVERFGLFDIAYVPFNFAYMFLQGFHLEFTSPTLLTFADVDPFGTAITFASPFIFTAFWARRILHRRGTGGAGNALAKNLLRAAWASICLTLVHLLLYYNNGSRQWNAQRFSLDFLPLLIILVAVGVKPQNEKVWKATIVYSIFLNVLTLALMAL